MDLRRPRFSISVIFLVHGMVVASWVSRIPAIQAALHLSPAKLGTLLLAATAGSLVSMPITGILIHKAGSRAMVMVTTAAFCLTLPLLAMAGSTIGLAAALFLFGASAGGMDVSMNVEAAALENRYNRPIMSAFHGLFSAGGMVGAAIGGAFAQAGFSPLFHFWASALAFGAIAAAVMAWLPPGSSDTGGSLAFRFTRELWLLGALGFCILIGEGAMSDWTGVYLRNSLGTSSGVAALGYSVFSAAMAIGRFAGDRLALRIGKVRMVRGGALLAAAGLMGALLLGNTRAAMIGFACVGAGFSTIIPIVFGAGANVNGVAPGAGVAAVTTAGYLGFLVGPPLIGFTAEYTSLRLALGVVAVLSLVAALLASAAEPGTA